MAFFHGIAKMTQYFGGVHRHELSLILRHSNLQKVLKKFQRKHEYQVSINMATETVIEQCASTRSADETWLTNDMQIAYKKLATTRPLPFCRGMAE